ncbi:MAG TPA: hypothetical protein VN420_00250 [Candidatus Fimivivens sp.]|nr:hypothetical protein [Candidatus Fimivivens sp.]
MKPSTSHVVRQDAEIAAAILRKREETKNVVAFRKSLNRKEWGEYLKYLLSRLDHNLELKAYACEASFENDFPIALPFSNTENPRCLGCELLPTFSFSDDPESISPEEREVISAALSDLVSIYLETSPDFVDSLIRGMPQHVYIPADRAGSVGYLAPFDYNSLKAVCDSPTTELITKYVALNQFWSIPDSERRSITKEFHEMLFKYREVFSGERIMLNGIIYALLDFGYLEDAIDTMKLVSVWPESYSFDKRLYVAINEKGLKDTLLSDSSIVFPEPVATKLKDLLENGPAY